MSQPPRNSNTLYFLLTSIGLGIIFFAIVLLGVFFKRKYQPASSISTNPRNIDTSTQEFAIQKITIKDNSTDCVYEIKRNGSVTKYCGPNRKTTSTKILASDKILDFFAHLDKKSFFNLDPTYFSDTLDLQITIESNFGITTIHINNQGTNTNPLSDLLDDLLDDFQDIKEDVDQPDPSPPPVLPSPSPSPPPTVIPTPSPSPGFSPLPSASPPLPSPGVSAEPFDCSMLDQTDVTVSNIRCMPNN